MKKSLPDIRREYLEKGDPTGWFEEVYAMTQDSEDNPPWARLEADIQFASWAEKTKLNGENVRIHWSKRPNHP